MNGTHYVWVRNDYELSQQYVSVRLVCILSVVYTFKMNTKSKNQSKPFIAFKYNFTEKAKELIRYWSYSALNSALKAL